MATWYIHGDEGNDANLGTESSPRATPPADGSITTGDIFNLAGNIRGVFSTSGKVVTIQQWSGEDQPVIRGDTIIAASGWAAAGNGFSKNIGAGLELNNTSSNNDAGTADRGTLVLNYDANISADGQHYGHGVYDTALNVAAASGATTFKYHYSTATGLLTGFFGGLDPNAAGCVVAYVNTAGLNAIKIVNGSGSTVTGINGALFCSGDGNSYFIRFEGCYGSDDTVATDCIGYDFGYHTYGGVTKAKNVKFVNCDAIGLWRGGTHFVFHTDDNAVTVTGCRMINCSVLGGRYRDFAGTGVIAGTLAQYGLLCHGPGGGTPVVDVQVDNCDFVNADTIGFSPVAITAADAGNPENGAVWSDYPVRVSGGSATNVLQWTLGGNTAIRRMRIHGLSSGTASPSGGMIGIGAAGTVLFEACEIIGVGTGQTNWCLFGPLFAGSQFNLTNNSIYVSSTAAKHVFQYNFVAQTYVCRGNIFEMAGAGTNTFCLNDSNVAAANHDFIDNVYRIASGDWSGNSSFNTQAEWVALIDTSAIVESSSIFLNATTNLELTSASPTRGDTRATTTIEPTAGINTIYDDDFGAYQYPSGSSCTVGSTVFTPGAAAGMVA